MKNLFTITILLFCGNLQAQWYPVNSNTTENLHDIFFIDSLTGYCVGGGDIYGYPEGNGVVLETTDGGENWTTIFSYDSLSIQHVAIIEETASTKLYGFATKMATPYLVSTFVSTQLQNWSVVTTPYKPKFVEVYANTIYFMDDLDLGLKKIQNNAIVPLVNDISLFGVNQYGLAYLNQPVDSAFLSTDYGNSIAFSKKLPQEMGSNQMLYAEISAISDTIIIKGNYPPLVTYADLNNVNWTTHFAIEVAPSLRGVILNNGTIYGIDAFQKICVTTNLGETWQVQDNLGVRINRLYFYNDSMGFAVGEDGAIFKTTNGGGITSTIEIEGSKKKIKVFPNPSHGLIRVETSKEISIKSIALIDMNGKVIRSYAPSKRQLDVSGMVSGQYLLLLETNKGSLSKKVFVE